jgi:hypothetical protein
MALFSSSVDQQLSKSQFCSSKVQILDSTNPSVKFLRPILPSSLIFHRKNFGLRKGKPLTQSHGVIESGRTESRSWGLALQHRGAKLQ